jgi:hypothetical protein
MLILFSSSLRESGSLRDAGPKRTHWDHLLRDFVLHAYILSICPPMEPLNVSSINGSYGWNSIRNFFVGWLLYLF